MKTAITFLVTSRPYFDIERRFKELIKDVPTIRLAGEEETASISKEIDIVIKAQVQKIGSDLGLRDSVQTSLQRELLGMTHRTYLWLKLIVDVIYKRLEATTKTELQQAIRSMPPTVDDAYEEILKRSPNISRARKLLHIIVAAVRPLTLKEINLALAIKEESHSQEELELKQEEDFKNIVTNLCGLFVAVFDSKVYLIHQTAKEFLVKDDAIRPSTMGIWKYSLEPKESDLILAKICMRYLCFAEFESDPLVIPGERRFTTEAWKYIDQYKERHAFLEYSARQWTSHFRRANTAKEHEVKLALEVCNVKSKRFLTWFQVSTYREQSCPNGFTELMMGSYFGLETVVTTLLERGAAIEATDEHGQTALHKAAKGGDEEIIQILLDNGADIEAKDEIQQTALLLASHFGNKGAVRTLLGRGADIEARDRGGATAHLLYSGQLYLHTTSANKIRLAIYIFTLLRPALLTGYTSKQNKVSNPHIYFT
jgi:hypothetical protein